MGDNFIPILPFVGGGIYQYKPIFAVFGGIIRFLFRRIDGRFIDARAYAAYVRGRLYDQGGSFDQAEQSYAQALTFDAESVELWTRLGAARCARM